MDFLLASAGAFLIAVTVGDVLWTTMGTGGGLLTRRLSSVMWKGVVKVYRLIQSRLILGWGGAFILMSVFITWILLVWLGWTLVFSSADVAIFNSQTDNPATLVERIYFVGFTIFTLGTGDYVAREPLWQVLTVVASSNGLFLITLSITYLVPVVQAATQVRQVAVYIASLGLSPHDFLLNVWTDDNQCAAFETHLPTIAHDLAMLEQRHITYPILHYFHTPTTSESIAISVAKLDEALTILSYGMPANCQLETSVFKLTRHVITEFLNTLAGAYVEPEDQPPPIPSLRPLSDQGLPTLDEEGFDRDVGALSKRRRMLWALVRNSGWTWDHVYLVQPERSAEQPLEHVLKEAVPKRADREA